METAGECWIIPGNGTYKPKALKKLHPLLFPPVLNKIFGHLSLWNHKKCRLVCKTWDQEAKPFLRLNCKVNLTKLVTNISSSSPSPSSTSTSTPSRRLSDNSSPTDYDLNYSDGDLHLDVEDDDETCHSKSLLIYGISELCTSYIIEEDPIIIPILMNQSSLPLQIKYLELKDFKWNFNQLYSCILKVLPYLEELRLPIQCSMGDDYDGDKWSSTTTIMTSSSSPSPMSMMSMSMNRNNRTTSTTAIKKKNPYISSSNSSSRRSSNNSSSLFYECFPRLKTIIINLTIKDLQVYDHKNTTIQPLLKLLSCTPNLEEIYYPNIVQFTSPFDNPARVLLENIIYFNPMRLSSLKIDTFISNRDLKLLGAKSLPLKSLQITLTPDISCRILYEFFDTIESTLRSLTLTFRDGFKLSSSFPSLKDLERMTLILWNGRLDFVSEIKKLKTLIVVLMELEEPIALDHRSQIEEMDIHAVRSSKGGLVKGLLTMAPKVTLKRLTLDYVTDEMMRNIFTSLPALEEFVVLYGGFTEEGITGLCSDGSCDNSPGGPGLIRRQPSIVDLQNLRSLVLTGDLTDFMIIFGVGQLRELRRLELMNRSSTKIGDKSLKKIADSMNNLELLRLKNFPSITEQGLEYLGSKLAGREIHILDCN